MKKLFSTGLIAFLSIALFTQCTDSASDAAGTADTSATTASASPASGPAEDWRIGVQFWTFKEFPFVKAVEKADSAGVKFIEAFPGQALGGTFKDSFNINMSAESRQGVKDLLA